MKIKLLLLACFGVFSAHTVFSQSKSCVSEKYSRELAAQFPEHQKTQSQLEQQIQNYISQHQNLRQASGTVRKMPVVIHVVTETGCDGISKAQILNGLEIINKAFRRQNADTANTRAIFKPYATDTEIEFVLARKDPNGNPTEGIKRISTASANALSDLNAVKAVAPAWDQTKYLNIWLLNSLSGNASDAGGYSLLPNPQFWNQFGVVVLSNLWGKQGAVAGSTATTNGNYPIHLMAHCFNLLHDWGGCAATTGGCATGDMVLDTPPCNPPIGVQTGCNFTLNTCTNDVACGLPTDMPDQIENYLYLSDPACHNMFTVGQKMRIDATIYTIPHLQDLMSLANAAFTGIDSNPAPGINLGIPTPYFCASNTRICQGNSVTFTDKSYNATSTAWNWTFPGGTPSTSTAQNPVITYNTPGKYDVLLTVSNPIGVQHTTFQNQITVVPATNLINVSFPNYYQESFEESTFPVSATANRHWELKTTSVAANPQNWVRTNAAALQHNNNGTHSLVLANANMPAGTVSTLITPNFIGGAAYVFLEMAYAKKTAQPTEVLKFYYSHDCGVTWNGPIKTLIGNQLVTNGGAQVANFVPTTAEWRMENLVHPNQLSSVLAPPHVMFKIEVTSNGGGNLYIDNFTIGHVLGTKEAIAAQNIQLFPNPLTSETGIHFELKTPETGKLKIFDVLGNEVYAGKETTFSSGKHSVSLANQKLSSGVYVVQLELGGKLFNTKLLVQ